MAYGEGSNGEAEYGGSPTGDQTVLLGLLDDSTVYGGVVSTGAISLPIVDGSAILAPEVETDQAEGLPLIDGSSTAGPDVILNQTAGLPLLDGSAIYGPSISRPQMLTLDGIFGGMAFGPRVKRLYVAPPPPGPGDYTDEPPAPITVDVYDRDGTHKATLGDSYKRSWLDQHGDTGTGRLTLDNDDADLPSVDFDDIVRFSLDDEIRFAALVEAKDVIEIAEGEEVDEVTDISGRGTLAILDEARVLPSRGVGALPIEEVRSFSWVAPDFDTGGWPNAKQIIRRDQATVPESWPDPTAYQIWADRDDCSYFNAPSGICLFDNLMYVAEDMRISMFGGFDNRGALYFDGAQVMQSPDFGYVTPRRVDLSITAGFHTIRAWCENYNDPPLNPGQLIVTVWKVDTGGLLETLLTHSDYTWKCLPYVTVRPGFTPGKVIRLLVEDAQADGALAGITLGFTDYVDSNGAPWVVFPEITAQVGRSLLEVLQEMAASSIDVDMAAGSNELRAWNYGTRGVVRPITLQATDDPETSDFVDLSHSGRRTRVNHLLIRYAGGWTEVSDPSSIGTYGKRSDVLEIGTVATEDEAKRIGTEQMALRSAPSFATKATLDPGAPSRTPYLGPWDVADTVTCHDETASDLAMRTLSIGVDEDEEGDLTYGVELRDLRTEALLRHDSWLKRMAQGTLAGGSKVSAPADQPGLSDRAVSPVRVAEFSHDDAVPLNTSPRRPADSSGNLVEWLVSLTEASTSGSVVVQLIYENTGAVVATATLIAGRREISVSILARRVVSNTDYFQARVISTGTNAKGLDCQARAVAAI